MEELLQKTGMHNDKKNSHVVPTPNPAFQSPPYVNDERAVVRERIDSLDYMSVPNWHKYDETEDFRGQRVRNYMPQVEFAGHGSLLDENDLRYRLGDPEKRYGPYVWIKAEKEDRKGRAEVDKRDKKELRNWRAGCTDRDQRKRGRDKILVSTNLGTLRKGQGAGAGRSTKIDSRTKTCRTEEKDEGEGK